MFEFQATTKRRGAEEAAPARSAADDIAQDRQQRGERWRCAGQPPAPELALDGVVGEMEQARAAQQFESWLRPARDLLDAGQCRTLRVGQTTNESGLIDGRCGALAQLSYRITCGIALGDHDGQLVDRPKAGLQLGMEALPQGGPSAIPETQAELDRLKVLMAIGEAQHDVIDMLGRFDAHFEEAFTSAQLVKIKKIGQRKCGDRVLIEYTCLCGRTAALSHICLPWHLARPEYRANRIWTNGSFKATR